MNSEQPLTESHTDRSASDRALTVALETYLQQLESGESPDAEQLMRQHPAIADRLRSCLESLQLVEHAAGELSEPNLVDGIPHCDRALGDFRLVREIGRGGMGVVYEAEQVSLARHVAVKVLPFAAILDDRQLRRFKNEAQAAALLKHPNIVSVYGVGCERGVHYFAMELIDGWSLAEVIGHLQRQDESAKVDETAHPATEYADTTPIASLSTEYSKGGHEYFRSVARLGVQVAAALEYAHREGVIHRDIKPSNLLLSARGNLWITDFGLAQIQGDHNLTMTGDLVGTLRYMSPEQAAGRKLLDHRTDIYSLGVTLYELLTLRPAFPSEQRQELLRQVIESQPRPPRGINGVVPKDLVTIVLKAISKEPETRYDTAAELAEDLQRFLAEKPIRAHRTSRIHHVARWARRNLLLATLGSLFAALLIVLAVVGPLVALRQSRLASDLRRERDNAQLDRREAGEALDRTLRQLSLVLSCLTPDQAQLREETLSLYESLLESEALDHKGRFEVATAFYRVGRMFRRCGQPLRGVAVMQRAQGLLERLVSNHPSEQPYRLQLARVLTVLGERRRAIDLTQRLAEDDPDEVQCHRLLGDCYWLHGKNQEKAGYPQEAERLLLLGVRTWQFAVHRFGRQDPDRGGLAYAKIQLGGFYRRQGRFEDAEYEITTAIKMAESLDESFWLDPVNRAGRGTAYWEFGWLLLCVQRPEEAEAAARTAIAYAEDLVKTAPDLSWGLDLEAAGHFLLCDALLCMGRNDAAEKAIRIAVDRWQQLAEDIPSVHQFREDHARSCYRLGCILWHTHRPEDARAMYRRALERADDPRVETRRMWARRLSAMLIACPDVSLRDPQRGLDLAQAALQPQIVSGWQLLGAAFYRNEEWQQAINALNTCMELRQGDDAVDWVFLAMAHWQREQQAEAIHWYQRARNASDRKRPLSLQNFSHPFHLRDLLEEAEALMGIERETRVDNLRPMATVRHR